MSLPEPSLPGPNQNSPNYPKPKIHTSKLIATANQKIDLEVTVLEVTGHRSLLSQGQVIHRRKLMLSFLLICDKSKSFTKSLFIFIIFVADGI